MGGLPTILQKPDSKVDKEQPDSLNDQKQQLNTHSQQDNNFLAHSKNSNPTERTAAVS